jgi:PAS domain S-box-containing protein
VSNVTEALIGAACLRLFLREPLNFDSVLHVSAFLFAGALAAFLSSFLDSGFVALNRWGHSGYWETWRTRFWSNATASLTFVPLIVTWHAVGFRALREMGRMRLVEGAVFVTGLLGVTLLVFDSTMMINAAPALIYLPLPFLIWASARFGPPGASVSFALLASLVIWGSGHGLGPLGTQQPAENAFSVRLLLLFVGPTILFLAAALAERRRAEQSLRSSDRRFQLVLRATNDAVYEREMATDAVAWSGNGLAQFGYLLDQCPTRFSMALKLIHPEDTARAMRSHATAIEGNEQLWQSEFRLRRHDGSYAHVQEQGFIVRDARGQPLQMVGALTDITERRDADELSQRLAQASRLTAMGELTASIAHEINQPISAILINVDAAEMLLDAGDRGSAELRQILREIRDDDVRASEVMRRIRDLIDKREARFEQFELNGLIQAVMRLVGPTMRRRGVVPRAQYAGSLQVYGDRIHIQQVLLNLLFNGADAMSTVPESQRQLQIIISTPQDGFAMVSVRDWGHGIAPDHVERIFDSFFTTKKNGMGMGLAIARSLVELNGGRIWAENNDEGGAVLRFTIPLPSGASKKPCLA